MSFRDDEEDLFISPSGQASFESRERAEQKAREAKAREKGQLLDLQKQILSGQITAAQADEETKRLQQQSKDDTQTFGTKTLKEEEAEEILTGATELTTDNFVEESHKAAKRKEEEGTEISNENS